MSDDDRTLPVDAAMLDELRRLADQLPAGRPDTPQVGPGGTVPAGTPGGMIDLRSTGAKSPSPETPEQTLIADDDSTDALRLLYDQGLRGRAEPVAPYPPQPEPFSRQIETPASLIEPTAPRPPEPVPQGLIDSIADVPPVAAPPSRPTSGPVGERWVPPTRIASPESRGRTGDRFPSWWPMAAVAVLAVVVIVALTGTVLLVLGSAAGDGDGGATDAPTTAFEVDE